MSATPCLQSQNGEIHILERDGNFRIGPNGADINLKSSQVVADHALVIRVRDRVMLKPEKGVVHVNNQPVTRSVTLQVGDVVLLGDVTLELVMQAGSAATTPPPTTSQALPPSLNRKPAASFQLEDALFDEPVTTPPTPPAPPPSPPSSPPSPPSYSPSMQTSEDDNDDDFLQGIQSGLAPTNKPARATPPAPRSPAPPQPQPPSVSNPTNLTDAECRTVLQAFFHNSQIYKEKKGGGLELNFSQRWSRTSGTFGRSWVLATEGLKLGFKAMEWLANLEDRKERPADYVDAAIRKSVENCIDVAYDRLMMQPTLVQYPLVIYGPVFWREPGVPLENICARKGDDGYVRFSTQQVSILVLDDDQIGIFMCVLDTIAGRIGSHKTRSYNYKDIVSVADEDTTIEVEMQEGSNKINVYAFNIEVSSGRNLSITLNSQTIRELFDGDALEQPEHQQTVNVIRQMWRTKKSQ